MMAGKNNNRAVSGPLAGVLFLATVLICLAGSLLPVSAAPIKVADYCDDFDFPNPPTGWSYQWNENGAIGSAANYSDLLWNGVRYDSDGDSGLPDPEPARYVMLRGNSGHPGFAQGNGNAHDRFAIAGYTIGEPGDYFISDSSFENSSAGGDGVELRVYVNDVERLARTVDDEGSTNFDMDLGELISGDTIYVAMGPRGNDSYDTTHLDFTVNQVPEPAAVGLLVLGGCLLLWRRRASA